MFYQIKEHFKKQRIAIIGGTGAVGSYFSKQLVGAGHCVSIIGKANSPNLKHIQKDGLMLITSEGKLNIPSTAFNYVGNLEQFHKDIKNKGIQNIVIICLKQYDMSFEVAKQVSEITDKNSLIGIVANGLPFYFMRGLNCSKQFLDTIDHGGCIAQQMQDRQIVGIQPVIACKVISKGVIHISRPMDAISVTVGFPEGVVSRKIEALQELFMLANIKTTVSVALHKSILEKLQFALSINTLSAILEKNLRFIFNSNETQKLIQYSITLLNQISMALNLGTLRSYEQFKMISITKEHFSSLYHDFKEGKSGEIEAIVDATMELAQFLGGRTYNNGNGNQNLIPDLKPLEILRNLLNQKAKNIEINRFQLEILYKACQIALGAFGEKTQSTVKIRCKL